MNIDYSLIGKRIKQRRNELGYTQEKLAEKLDVSVGYVSQVERGITKISLDLLAEISTILDCDVSSFINDTAYQSPDYLGNEITKQLSFLDHSQRKLIIGIIQLMLENK